VDTEAELRLAIAKLTAEPCIGFDTESRPSFEKGRNYPVSLLQLATPNEAFIIRIRKTGFPDELKDFFESPVEKIGVGLADDFRKLNTERKLAPQALVDLSEIARKKGQIKSSLRVLSAKYLQQRIVKSSQKTNWARINLTESQLRYAATDAWACLLIRPLLDADE
jgi:ribonuclease D